MIYVYHLPYYNIGWNEVTRGGIFGGKAEVLIRRARRAHITGQGVAIEKSAVDKRYSECQNLSCAVPEIKRNLK